MKTPADSDDFLAVVARKSGQTLQRCYFCKKCASGCPVASYYDYLPYELFRMAQFGLKKEVLSSAVIWICSTCSTCAVRCPNDIDIVKVMDTLKEMSIEEGIKAGENRIKLFHLLFLGSLKRFGRLHEVTLLGLLKFRTGQLFRDLRLGMNLMRKGKLSLFPTRIKGRRELKKILKKAGLK